MRDVEKFIAGLHEYIGRALSPLAGRIKALEDRAPVAGPSGEKGEQGLPGDKGLDGQHGKDGAAGLDGKDGRDGIDGKDGAPGADGAKGEKGEPGPAGREGIDGKDGAPGERGEKGEPGKDGAPGADGRPGADGKSVSAEDMQPVLDGLVARWQLEFVRRAADTLQRAIDKMPAAKDGRDGFGFDAMDVVDDGDGNVTLRFTSGDQIKDFPIRVPRFKDCGVWKEGAYRQGDGATWGGSYWIAQKDAPAGKPGEGDDWRLAVKKGRDGRDGNRGEKGDRGAQGKDGREIIVPTEGRF